MKDKERFAKMIKFSTDKFKDDDELKEMKRLFEEGFNQKRDDEDEPKTLNKPGEKKDGDESDRDKDLNQPKKPEDKRDPTNEDKEESFGNKDKVENVNQNKEATNEKTQEETEYELQCSYVTPGSTYTNPLVHEVADSAQCFLNIIINNPDDLDLGLDSQKRQKEKKM